MARMCLLPAFSSCDLVLRAPRLVANVKLNAKQTMCEIQKLSETKLTRLSTPMIHQFHFDHCPFTADLKWSHATAEETKEENWASPCSVTFIVEGFMGEIHCIWVWRSRGGGDQHDKLFQPQVQWGTVLEKGRYQCQKWNSKAHYLRWDPRQQEITWWGLHPQITLGMAEIPFVTSTHCAAQAEAQAWIMWLHGHLSGSWQWIHIYIEEECPGRTFALPCHLCTCQATSPSFSGSFEESWAEVGSWSG